MFSRIRQTFGGSQARKNSSPSEDSPKSIVPEPASAQPSAQSKSAKGNDSVTPIAQPQTVAQSKSSKANEPATLPVSQVKQVGQQVNHNNQPSSSPQTASNVSHSPSGEENYSDLDKKPPIDWREAMNQVGGDKEFLTEVLQDLLDEAKTAENDLATSISAKDFGGVMRAAHRITGSASYLSCEPLRVISFALQQAGHAGEEDPTNLGLFVKIEEQYKIYCACVKVLREAIGDGIPENL